LAAIHQLSLGSDCRTWDLLTFTQTSCFDNDSTERMLQKELMKQWKKDCEQASIQQAYGKAWCSGDSAVVFWDEGACDINVPDPQRPAVYLMPPIRVHEDEVSKQEHGVYFFGEVGGGKIGVLRYELLI
jgi:predicted ATPase